MVITGDLFKLDHLGTYPLWKIHLVVTTEIEARTVSQRTVCILLECCLVAYVFTCCDPRIAYLGAGRVRG